MFGRRARSGPRHALYPVDLPGLDQVQWAEVAHAYGPATDIPDSIRGLASRDPEERKEAIGALFGTVWHQGTVYGATAPAVPFLVRVAITAGVPDREHVLGLLAAVSAGHGYVEVHRRLLKNGGATAEELDAQEQTERRWVADAHAAVFTAAPHLVGLLGDPDVEMRRAVAYTLASLDEEAQTISAELAARFQTEDDAPAAWRVHPHWGGRGIYFHDPDGHSMELLTRAP
jgi:catechol 2,3-dioxygenase-like lactoylglutathione lyase family enzyme